MSEIRHAEHFSMLAPLLLLCCVSTLRTSLSFVMVQTPEFISASVGSTFSIKCTLDQQIDYCYNSVSWYKVNERTRKMNNVAEIKVNDVDDDKRSCTGTIDNAQVQHSGFFYCLSLYNKMVLTGTGTRVIITDNSPLRPSIILYTPMEVDSVSEVDTDSILLQCVVMDTVPSQISVFWVIDEDERRGWTESGWTGDDDSASQYTRAQIMIPVEEWREAARIIECVVKYENKSLSRTLHRESHSDATCTWLLYGGCSVATFTIVVAIIVAMCLRKEKRVMIPVKRHCADVDTRSKRQTHGKQDTLRTNVEKPTASEVEYSCLNPEIFQLNVPVQELD